MSVAQISASSGECGFSSYSWRGSIVFRAFRADCRNYSVKFAPTVPGGYLCARAPQPRIACNRSGGMAKKKSHRLRGALEAPADAHRGRASPRFPCEDKTDAYGEPCVLKRVLNPARDGRFRDEVEAVKTLSHPNVVKLLDHSALDAPPGDERGECPRHAARKGGDLAKVEGRYRGKLDESTVANKLHLPSRPPIRRDHPPRRQAGEHPLSRRGSRDLGVRLRHLPHSGTRATQHSGRRSRGPCRLHGSRSSRAAVSSRSPPMSTSIRSARSSIP